MGPAATTARPTTAEIKKELPVEKEEEAAKPAPRPQSAILKAAMRGRPPAARVAHVMQRRVECDEQLAAQAAQAAPSRKEAAAPLGERTVQALRERQKEQRAAKQKLEARMVEEAATREEAIETLRSSTAAAREALHRESLAAQETRQVTTARREASLARLAADQKELEHFGEPARQAAFEANPYLVQRRREQACRLAKERAEAEESQRQRVAAVKSRVAHQVAREKVLREKEAAAKATQRPLPHVNLEEPRPRTRHPESSIVLT